MIDYSHERTEEVPDKIKVYGYPVIITDELKQMAINKLGDFLPADNEIKITKENFEEYLTNCYLDTTQGRKEYFNLILFATLILLFIMIALLIFTIFDRDKIVDNLDEVIDQTVKSTKKKLNITKEITQNIPNQNKKQVQKSNQSNKKTQQLKKEIKHKTIDEEEEII